MSGQGVGGESPEEKGLNSGNKACCSGWEGPPSPARSVYSDDSSRNRGWPPRYPSRRRAGPESLIALRSPFPRDLTFSRTPAVRELKAAQAARHSPAVHVVRYCSGPPPPGARADPLRLPENNLIFLKCRKRPFSGRSVFLFLPAAFVPTSASSLRAQCSPLHGRGARQRWGRAGHR